MPKGKILMGKGPKKAPVPGDRTLPKPGGRTLPLPKRGGGAVPKRRGPLVDPKRKKLTPSTLKAKQAVGKAKPTTRRSGSSMSGYNYPTNQTAPGFTGGNVWPYPSGMDWEGSTRRPQLDKMSPTGSTTTTLDYSESNRQDLYRGAELANAGREYAKNVDSQVKKRQNDTALRRFEKNRPVRETRGKYTKPKYGIGGK